MGAQRHFMQNLMGLVVTACMALAILMFATAAGAATGNGNGNGNANAFGVGNGNASGNGNPNGTVNTNANSNGQAANHQTSGTAGTSGTVTSPQPLSNADNNGVGANVSGPYDSTRNGSPSLNGNGNGNATGEPCAGCVGKADNKNPQGQLPGPSDLNAGYECDRNNGIGKTNPAHTGCTESNVIPPPVTPPVFPPPVVPILPSSATRPTAVVPELGATVNSATGAVSRPAGLAFTGSTILPEILAGVLTLTIGMVMLAGSRPRRRYARH